MVKGESVNYPRVKDEYKTLAKIKEGFSIARLGDGDLKCMQGRGYSREKPDGKMANELRQLVKHPNPKCLVGIPNMVREIKNYKHWLTYQSRFCEYLSDIDYYSAFISRPDACPSINNAEYMQQFIDIWRDKKVVIIGSKVKKNALLRTVQLYQSAQFIECPFRGAYSAIDELEQKALNSGADIVLLSAGPTATCLANRLSLHVQAVDCGHIGVFMWRRLKNAY